MGKKEAGDMKSQGMLDRFKRNVAHYINKRINSLSNTKKKIWLLIFGLLTAFLCVGLVVQAIRSDHVSSTLSIDPLSLPRSLNFPDRSQPELSLEREYKHVLKFRQLLDSLQRSPEKRSTYDSILLNRPGLEDSINLFLKRYESHFSN